MHGSLKKKKSQLKQKLNSKSNGDGDSQSISQPYGTVYDAAFSIRKKKLPIGKICFSKLSFLLFLTLKQNLFL